MEEAQARAAELNKSESREAREEMYKRWVADGDFDAAWLEQKKDSRYPFYYTYEAKESKSK